MNEMSQRKKTTSDRYNTLQQSITTFLSLFISPCVFFYCKESAEKY